MSVVERPLTPDEEAELDLLFSGALGLLPPIPDQSSPDFLIGAVHLLIEAVRAGQGPEAPLDDVATALGALWGDELCRVAGWSWCYLTYDSGLEGAAICPPDRGTALLPVHYLHRLLVRPELPNDCLPRFRALCRGEALPTAGPPGRLYGLLA